MASFEEADAASTSSSLTCRFSQCFESKGVHEEQSEGARTHLVDDFPVVFTACDPRRPSARTADTLTTVQFDATGEYLATGDKGGPVQRATPLRIAAQNDHVDVVRALVEQDGIDLDKPGNTSEAGGFESPLQVARQLGHAAIVKILLAAGAKLDDEAVPDDDNTEEEYDG